MKQHDESELVLKLSKDPNAAMSILYQNYNKQLYHTAYGILKDHTLAKDAKIIYLDGKDS